MTLRKAVLVTAFLVVLGCSGEDDGWEPAPGARVEESELEGLTAAAVSDFDLEWLITQPEPSENEDEGPSCFEVETGPCRVSSTPGLTAVLRDEGHQVVITLRAGIDSLEAGDQVDAAMTSRRLASTRSLRLFYETPELIDGTPIGPCDFDAERESDQGCAWRDRTSPGTGDEGLAMNSETLEETAFSAVAFARGHVFADVQVVRRGDPSAPDGLADDLAKALDEQIKQALAQ